MIKSSATSRLTITVVATILLPLIVYSVFEISSIKEDELVMETVYKDQLDAILFSANQYSDDAINGVFDKLENQLSDTLGFKRRDQSFLNYSNMQAVYMQRADSLYSTLLIIDSTAKNVDWEGHAIDLIRENKTLLRQLLKYKEVGYRKIEPKVNMTIDGKVIQVIVTILENASGQKVFLIGFINVLGFTENVLSPKLQQIAGEDLVISLNSAEDNTLIFCTDSLTKEVYLFKPMWLFPNLLMGISSQNKSVPELIAERTQYNLIATFILIFLLLFGFSLVVRNVRKEIKLAQTKSDFVSNVSHEIRTPLSLISMFAETLLLDRVPNQEKRKEYEEIIFKETNRLTNIVNKILNFSQIEANNRTYQLAEINPNELVDELMHDYAYHLDRNNFTYDIKKSAEVVPIKADKEAIYEAIVNLIDNAIKYSDEKRHMTISTGMREDDLFLEVTDQGIGISPNEIHQIFDKFYRVSEGNVHTRKGAGLGLALVHHIMEAHHGDIEVDSSLGRGSTFRLIFKKTTDGQNTSS